MANKTLLDYVQKSLMSGVSEQQVRLALSQQGWSNDDVNQAFTEINTQQTVASTIPPTPNKKVAVKIIIGLSVLLVLGGAGYLVYSFGKNQVQDKTFENGSEVLEKLSGSYDNIKSFEFQGIMKIKVREENAKSTFQGSVTLPLTIQITQDTDNLSRYNDPEYKTPKNKNYHRETIAVDNKIFKKLTKESDWKFSGSIANPLEKTLQEKIPNYQPRPLPNISWLTLNYADNLEYIGVDSNLYRYKVLPKSYKFGPAFDPVRNFRITPGISAFDVNLVDTTISGEVWVDKNYQIVKEKYNIPAHSGGIDIEISYSDYGKNVVIKAPIDTSALDELYKQIEAGKDPSQAEKEYQEKLYAQNPDLAAKQRDERRFNDIMIQTWFMFEFYKDSHNNEYPVSLDDLQYSTGKTPTAPIPADGNCTEEQNKYKYTRTSPTTFKLTFCLGNQRPPLPAGFQTMTEKGIACIGEKQDKPYYCLPPNSTTR